MPDLHVLFLKLPSPPLSPADAPLLVALPVPQHPGFRIARDAGNRPLVLLESPASAPSMPPLALEHIRIEHARRCRIQQPDGTAHSGVFTIFSCTSGDTVLQEHFLLVAGALIATTPPNPQPGMVAAAIETMAELFRALQAPARESVQGLWAEVLLIAESRSPTTLARAWRVATDDRFDFSSTGARVEVKSARGPERIHHFALEQLRPPTGTRAFVASIRVEHAGAGTTLHDLLAELRVALAESPDVLLRIESVVATTLGSTFRTAVTERFDRETARASLAYYRVQDIPSIRENPPPGVSDVRFRSNLESVPRARIHDRVAERGDELIGSLPPTRERPLPGRPSTQ